MRERPTDRRAPARPTTTSRLERSRATRQISGRDDRPRERSRRDGRAREKSDASRGNEAPEIDTSDGVGASRVWVWSRTRGTYSVVCEWYVYVGAGV